MSGTSASFDQNGLEKFWKSKTINNCFYPTFYVIDIDISAFLLLIYSVVSKSTEAIFEVKIQQNADTGIVVAEHWLLGGKGQSPPNDRPSTVLFDDEGRKKTLLWKASGELHRENGPAWIEFDPATGVRVQEQYFEHGQCHRPGRQPAHIQRDPHSGEITKVRYFERNVEKFWRNLPPIAPR